MEAYLHARLGEGARLQDYLDYLEGYYTSTLYSKELGKQQNIADAEIESYFEENAEALSSEYAISKDSGNAVDVRLILIELEGGTEDEYGNITYSNEDWNTCYQEALALYEQWKSGDADEDSFAALSEDENLTTDILPGELADAVEDWCFDESRQSGDHRMIKTDDGYYLVYYVDGEAAWIRYSRNGIIDIRLAEIVEALASENPFTADFTSIALGTVDLS